MQKTPKIGLVSLGCAKNLVDAQRLTSVLIAMGYEIENDYAECDVVVVNTCGFISDAKEESINTILEFAQAKQDGRISQLYVMGCLSQRYREQLQKEIPEVDRFYGKFDYKQLLVDLGKTEIATCVGQRSLTTPSHYFY